MKTMKKIIMIVVASVFVAGCNEGIDPISSVAPGPDVTAPSVTIKSPSTPKINIPFTDTKTDMGFEFEVTDDIEIQTISVTLDGTKIKEYTSFKDYRRSLEIYTYEDLPIGDHNVTVTANDLAGKSTVKSFDFLVTNVYEAKYDGEITYMPFEGGLYTDLVSKSSASAVGAPGFSDGKLGKGYQGKTDAYLAFNTTGIINNPGFSATFWYKVNTAPDRSGILVISKAGAGHDGGFPYGFRLFREGGAASQTVKINVGTASGDRWNDGGVIDAAKGEWVHVAVTIGTEVAIYLNGVLTRTPTALPGPVDWTGCTSMSIGSGAPEFIGWGHLSDSSIIDELRVFDKALTAVEVKAVMDGN
jgi:hypothetical protein